MAKGNLPACLAVTLAYEGGFTRDRRDPGNWTGGKVGVGKLKGTKFGVSAASYPDLDIEHLTVDQARPIYEASYWKPIRGDDLPTGLDLATFDFGVNSGPVRAARTLQSVLMVGADGKIGAQTLKAAILADTKETIQALCAKRLSFLSSLKTWATFKRGWSKRVADVEAKAVAMWLKAVGTPAPSARAKLQAEATKASDKASVQTKSATGLSGGTAVGVGTASGWEPNWWLLAGFAVLVGALVLALVLKARQHKDRATAYQAAAAVVA